MRKTESPKPSPSPPDIVRVLIVDDHPLVRLGLRAIEQESPSLKIVGEAASKAGAIEQTALTQPNVVLLDIRLPDGSGLEACRRIKELHPHIKVLVLTSFADESTIIQAMGAGADGYVLKENDASHIVEAIHKVAGGGGVFDPVVVRCMAKGLKDKRTEPEPKLDDLTPQEARVLSGVAEGKTNKEIAQDLGLTPKTVRNYLERVFGKLGVHRRSHAAVLFSQTKNP